MYAPLTVRELMVSHVLTALELAPEMRGYVERMSDSGDQIAQEALRRHAQPVLEDA